MVRLKLLIKVPSLRADITPLSDPVIVRGRENLITPMIESMRDLPQKVALFTTLDSAELKWQYDYN